MYWDNKYPKNVVGSPAKMKNNKWLSRRKPAIFAAGVHWRILSRRVP